MYQIKVFYNNAWEQEKFLTGSQIYMSFKEGMEVKRKLQKMNSITKYKLEKIN